MVSYVFYSQILEMWQLPKNAICCWPRSESDTLILLVLVKFVWTFSLRGNGSEKQTVLTALTPLYTGWWKYHNPTYCSQTCLNFLLSEVVAGEYRQQGWKGFRSQGKGARAKGYKGERIKGHKCERTEGYRGKSVRDSKVTWSKGYKGKRTPIS